VLTGLAGEVVVVWLVVVTGVVVWLVVVVVDVVDIVVADCLALVVGVVACLVAVGVVWVAIVWDLDVLDVLDVLWVKDDAWAARALRGLALLVVAVVGMAALCCFVELVDEPLPPHAARLSVSTTALRAPVTLWMLNSRAQRMDDLVSIGFVI
jgi:hypothetical protein